MLFLPGSSQGGGLGCHSQCLKHYYPNAAVWDFIDKNARPRQIFLTKLIERIESRFADGCNKKFNHIDLESSDYFQNLNDVPESILSFSGCSLKLFEFARKKGCKYLELESPNAHVSHCHEVNQTAYRLHPFEKPWLSRLLMDKMLAEYSIADRIWVNSEYSAQTFLERGVPKGKIGRRYLQIEAKYHGQHVRCDTTNSKFRVIYVGSLSVNKGVPILVEAFSKACLPNSELRLVGGTGSRGMWNYLEKKRLKDSRIIFGPSDPLPELLRSNLFVFPSWSDGYGLAGAEAYSVGLPLIVSENTGMKELVNGRLDCQVVKTGCVNSLTDSICWMYSRLKNP